MNWQTLDKLVPKPTRQVLLRIPWNKEAGSLTTYVIRWSSDGDVAWGIANGKSQYDAFAEIEP